MNTAHDDDEDESDFDDTALDKLENIEVGKLPLLPDYISMSDLINAVRINKVITQTQVEINEVCQSKSHLWKYVLQNNWNSFTTLFPKM